MVNWENGFRCGILCTIGVELAILAVMAIGFAIYRFTKRKSRTQSLKKKQVILPPRQVQRDVSPAQPIVFISYRRGDTGYIATMLAEKLVAQYGPDSVFLDIDNIPLGVDFRRHIDDEVARCNILLALVGDTWLTYGREGTRSLDDPGDFHRIEIEIALNRNIPVIPVLCGNARMPLERELPAAISQFAYRNAVELRSGSGLPSQIERLLVGLNSHFH